MVKKIIDYLKRDLDYPVEVSPDYKDGLHYYLDLVQYFDRFPFCNIVFDKDGIVQFNYSTVPPPNNSLGPQLNHTYIAIWALANLHCYLSSGEDKAKQEFIKHAQWLRQNHSQRKGHIVWQTMFDWQQYDFKMKAPLVTSMDQGLAISVMVRAYRLTGEKSYFELAKKAVPFYGMDLEDGGFCTEFKPGYIYYEMYPVRPLSKVLDGYAFALAGLYDVYLTDGDRQAKEFFDKGLKTLLNNIDFWDFRGYWSWFGRFYLSPPWYHKLNFCWVNVLADIAEAKGVKERIRGWNPRKHKFVTKVKIKTYFFLASRHLFTRTGERKTWRIFNLLDVVQKLKIKFGNLWRWIFLRFELILFEIDSHKNIPNKNFLKQPYLLKIVDKENLQEALSMDNVNMLKNFTTLLENGEMGFYAYLDNQVVHRSWIVQGPRKVAVYFNCLHLNLLPSEALIHYCQTHNGFRGLGIYPSVLKDIMACLSKSKGIDKFYIAIEKSNFSSISSVKKTGFVRRLEIRFTRFCGINYKRIKKLVEKEDRKMFD